MGWSVTVRSTFIWRHGDIDPTVESVRRRSWATVRTQSSSVNFYSWNISPWEFLFFSSWTSIFPPLLIILGLCLAALWDVFPVGHASERKPTEHFWIFMPCLTHFNGRRMLSSSSHRAETSLKCPVASVSSRHHVQIMSEGDDGLRNVGQEFRALGWKPWLWNCDAKAVVRHHEVTINLTLPCHRYVTAVFSAAASSSWTSSTSSPPKTSGGVRPPQRTKNTLKTLKTVDWVGFTNGDNVVK